MELDLLKFIQDNYTGEIITNTKSIIGPTELDIYLPELKMNTSITIQEDLVEYSEQKFKVYVFQNEGELKKKIKLQIL